MLYRDNLIHLVEDVIYGKRQGFFARALNATLITLSSVYAACVRVYVWTFDTGLRKQARFSYPIISVGNITTGGTGKTPTVERLCCDLIALGWKPAVLSYGYGGALKGRCGVVSDGQTIFLSPYDVGDEPYLLATRLHGVPIIVGKHRVQTGRIAVDQFNANILILDDGFQVWKLYRNMDIVLLRSDNPFDNGRLLPAGHLREAVDALSRAQCLIFTGYVYPHPDTVARVSSVAPEAFVLTGRLRPCEIIALEGNRSLQPCFLRDKKVLAVSGIANPNSFRQTLLVTGAVITDMECFQDHHCYSSQDIARINDIACSTGAEMILVTEKDMVKLQTYQFVLPTYALRVCLELDDETAFQSLITRIVGTPPLVL